MKVKTLMKKLEEFNPDADVKLNDYNGDVVLFVNARANDNNVVWLDGEHDIDLGEEIKTRFLNAVEEYTDEWDFYADLLEIGIDIDMVRRYMDDETGTHMKEFCEEHGLL